MKRARRTFTFGGEFYRPGKRPPGVEPAGVRYYRMRFLERAAELYPELLEHLRMVSPDDEKALLEWGRASHLTDPWCLALARDRARRWQERPHEQGWTFPRVLVSISAVPLGPLDSEDELLLRRTCNSLLDDFFSNPISTAPADYKAALIRRIGHAVDDYCDRIVEQIEGPALEAGFRRTPERREIQHIDWLVRHQIEGVSFASILPSKRSARQTVHKAVKDLANYIGLTVRAGPRQLSKRGLLS